MKKIIIFLCVLVLFLLNSQPDFLNRWSKKIQKTYGFIFTNLSIRTYMS